MNTPLSKAGWHLNNTYSQLPNPFFVKILPTPVSNPELVAFNDSLADELSLHAEVLKLDPHTLSGNTLPEGSIPITQAYAGHQYGYFTMLGDGRAILLGEQQTKNGKIYDIQLKGSGKTPFSRQGDGRAALGPMLREFLISEAMHAFGIPTSRSLSVTTTGETVFRGEHLPGAVLVRVASSHIRFGTFEYAAALKNLDHLKALADYTINRHDPSLLDSKNPYLSFFENVLQRQAALTAQWTMVGFVHGVMNTDNMTISGETIDYGPCAFMESYDPSTVFSSIDHNGRYAYSNQPKITHWNLSRLGQALLPLIDANTEIALSLLQKSLDKFPDIYKDYWLNGMRLKLGFENKKTEDQSICDELLLWMKENKQDYTNTFRSLSSNLSIFKEPAFQNWKNKWIKRLEDQPRSLEDSYVSMKKYNPAYIPRNHRVEEALHSATYNQDYTFFNRLLEVVKNPYIEKSENFDYTKPALPEEYVHETFCGT